MCVFFFVVVVVVVCLFVFVFFLLLLFFFNMFCFAVVDCLFDSPSLVNCTFLPFLFALF